jgi:hypothetical protein
MFGINLRHSFDRWRSNNFFLKNGYSARSNPQYFTDEPRELQGITWQPDVYPIAEEFAVKEVLRRSLISIVEEL